MIDFKEAINHCISETNYPEGKKYQGKVRDVYDLGDEMMMITTDRLSAFDRSLALIPFKGQVLTQVSAWWFEHTRHIIDNHLIRLEALNQMRVKKCQVFPVEFVVRGYITGSTSTSLWMQYEQGVHDYCGHHLPEGLVKNQQLETPIITPTTKSVEHDEPISAEAIVARGLMTQAQWDEASEKVLALYQFGVEEVAKRGLILVDTKYELGLDESDQIVLVDEVHTPDSSRFWLADSYQKRFEQGLAPESIDKEFIRLWYREHCDPYHDEVLPEAPEALVIELSKRYINLYERIVGQNFPVGV